MPMHAHAASSSGAPPKASLVTGVSPAAKPAYHHHRLNHPPPPANPVAHFASLRDPPAQSSSLPLLPPLFELGTSWFRPIPMTPDRCQPIIHRRHQAALGLRPVKVLFVVKAVSQRKIPLPSKISKIPLPFKILFPDKTPFQRKCKTNYLLAKIKRKDLLLRCPVAGSYQIR